MTSTQDFLDGMPATPAEGKKAESVVSNVKDEASKVAADLKETVSAAAMDARTKVGEAASVAADRVSETVSDAKSSAAAVVVNLARQARGASDAMKETSPKTAKLIHDAADGAEYLSKQIGDLTFNDIKASAGDFMKNRPVAAAGIFMVAGIVLASLFRSPGRDA